MWQPFPGFPFDGANGFPGTPPLGSAAELHRNLPPGAQAFNSLPGMPAWVQSFMQPQANSGGCGQRSMQPSSTASCSLTSTAQPEQQYISGELQKGGQPCGRKKALIVAVSYSGEECELKGTLTDAKAIRSLLLSEFGFASPNILTLWEDADEPAGLPTHSGIMQGLRWLVHNPQPGDSLVLYYSGHGGFEDLVLARDQQGRVLKRRVLTLVPLDRMATGEIFDTELNRLLVNPLPPGVKLTAIVDACHAGTMLDLQYQAVVQGGRGLWREVHEDRPDKGTSGGFAVLISACTDFQTSSDAPPGVFANLWGGAATCCFRKAIERRGARLSYEQLLLEMHYTCKEQLLEQRRRRLEEEGYGLLDPSKLGDIQEVTLSSNYAFDLGAPFSL